MRGFFRKLTKVLAYSSATLVIVLAIAVGLFRLFLPRLPEYQDQIKARTSAAIGMQVEFSGMDARWGLSGPELEFYDAELIGEDTGTRIIAAQEVRIGVAFLRLLFEQALVVDSVVIRNTSIDIRQRDDGEFRVQGLALDELLKLREKNTDDPTNIEIIGDDIELRFLQPGDERPRFFTVPRFRVNIDDNRIAVDANVELPEDLGRSLDLSAVQLLSSPEGQRTWDINVDAEAVSLRGWSVLSQTGTVFRSGTGDLELAMAWTDGHIASATADVRLADVSVDAGDAFSLSGRVEVDVDEFDWLIAAHDLVLAWPDREWPETALRIEASVDQDGQIVLIDTRASYLNLTDLSIIEPWLNDGQKAVVAGFAPTGIVRNLIATVSDIDSEEARFDVSAELNDVGVSEAAGRPGIRGFTGQVRANRSGGRLEIDSEQLVIVAPEYISEAISIRRADGTVIWRNSDTKTTILSDSIAIAGDFFQSQSNVQLILHKNGGSPEIDLDSTWSISDLARAKRFIPQKGLKPKLYDWFQMALVSGSIPRGTTTLKGPLDKFPFDDGEGRLLMNGSVRNMTFKYHKDWPATEQSNLEVTLDNARLYTTENSSVSAGISVANADVDIPDLRDPVLNIESFSTASLEAIREFSIQSPIAKVFGGQLDRVDVSGDASFNLELVVPLKADRIKEFEFVARVRSNNGTLAIEGLDPPITDLIGEVTIERDQITSEGLGGRFLDEAVAISLSRSVDPQFSVVASAVGAATAEGLIDGLGLPLEGLLTGQANYEARILFPVSTTETKSPLTIQVDSDLSGLGFDLPPPLSKAEDESLLIRGDIRFMPDGKTIESSGAAEDRVAWQVAFNRPEEFLDFDRGVVTLGGEESVSADTRGLHIRGTAETIRFQDWLNLTRRGAKTVGAADRIRSIDLVVENLHLLGQHLRSHRVRVDRSALDWLVQLDGTDVVGSVFVPYDFSGERAMVLEMSKMRLPGDDTAATDAPVSDIDPRKLPPIELRAADFALGDRYLGTVEATLAKTGFGLEATSISTSDESFSIDAHGRWLADEADPLGSHSFITATLNSSDVEKTMARLDYTPGIKSKSMVMNFDLEWSGGPRAEFFDVMSGDVEVRLGDGQLEEVEPGAGRLFGLLSIVALPKRLSLDFRDVFSKGFGFDEIAGTFHIDNGKTYTCDLSLDGPAADIGIVGEADLVNRTYDQTAVVSANVGNSLPIVGAVVAGPQVAAALLIFSQIFKKPLQEVGQVYYGIGGSWDNPDVSSANSAAFVASGELAGCLVDNE